eukprot:scaffold1833_cov255-Pinguiococcus_pyrenoidosus.AAC.8
MSSFEEDLALMEQMEAEAMEEEAEQLGALEDANPTPAADASTFLAADPRWIRPPAPPLDATTDAVVFQWIDVAMCDGDALQSNPCAGKEVVGATSGPVPILRLFGVTESGNSVCAQIHGFTPYFFASLPERYPATEEQREELMRDLNRQVEARGGVAVAGIELVHGKQSLMGYYGDKKANFLKVYTSLPSYVTKTRKLLEGGVNLPGHGLYEATTFESNVKYVLRFMIDCDISGANWVEVPAGTYRVRAGAEKRSHCQYEVDVFFNELVSHQAIGAWQKIAPLRTLSIDIECEGRKGHFPEADHDPVIQIACVLQEQGKAQPTVRAIFTLDTCLPIIGAHVITSDTESDLLMKFHAFLRATDPDILTGYNIQKFDFTYLLDRAAVLLKKRCNSALQGFPYWDRVRNRRTKYTSRQFQSAAYGKSDLIDFDLSGLVVLDLYPYVKRNYKLSSYSLNSVSAEFLGQQKEDVHHSIISDLQHGSDEDRRRLAVYCLKDAWLPIRLIDKLSILINTIEMARVTGVPIDYLLGRGQQIKVYSMLLRKCRSVDLLIPNLRRQPADATYEGATVIEPIRKFYQEPVATLDFASLYPSIMQAWNLCYSTLITPQAAMQMDDEDYEKSPCGFYFLRREKRKGILPEILEELLGARKRAKKDMKNATDAFEKAVQNGRQLALKVSANSVYGFTGATVGQLPCLEIASSVTSYGRELLLQTRSLVEAHYTKANGYQHDAVVVYGDTDSVMVNFGVATVAEAMPLAEDAAERVSKQFKRPILLEFEKVYFPYLLMNKKRYAGLMWTSPDKYDKMDMKGLETVRRDNCAMVRKTVDTCLRKILMDRDVPGAIQYAKGVISQLLTNKLDISMLVITKQLQKEATDSDYKSRQAHVELAARLKQRDEGSAPVLGDRIPYVIIQGAKGVPMYERAEDPVYVLDHNLPIDTEYYLRQQLENPLTRLFEPIIDNTQSLFAGDHTRTVSKLTPTARAGSIMMFAVKKKQCLGCKTPITDKKETLCKHCRGREGEIYAAKLFALRRCEIEFSKLWTQCQNCQGSIQQDVICSNRCVSWARRMLGIDTT